MTNQNSNFLKNLKDHRKDRGLTQKELATMLGISESFYCQIERGKRGLKLNLAIEISKIFEKSLDEIFVNSNLA